MSPPDGNSKSPSVSKIHCFCDGPTLVTTATILSEVNVTDSVPVSENIETPVSLAQLE